jgi:tight adherence protein B
MTGTIIPTLVFAAIAVAMVMVALAFGRAGEGQKRLTDRLERVAAISRPITEEDLEVRKAGDRHESSLDRLFTVEMQQVSNLKQKLMQAHVPLSVSEFLLICVVLSLVVIVGMLFVGLPVTVAVPGGLAFGAGLPYMTLNMMQARHSKRFLSVFPDALDLIVRGLKAGIPVSEAISSIGNEVSEPVGGEFRAIADQIRIGMTMDEALNESVDRVGIEDYRFFVITLAIQRETGGNLSETLANLSDIIRKRQELRLKVRALSSEARASAMILGALPFITAGIIMLLNPEYMTKMFTEPFGHVLLGVAFTMLTVGILVMWRMINFEI